MLLEGCLKGWRCTLTVSQNLFLFRSNLQNSKTDWPYGSSKKVFDVVELIIETLISKFLFLSVAMGWRIINPGTQQVHSSVYLDLNLEVTNKHVESTRVVEDSLQWPGLVKAFSTNRLVRSYLT